MRINKEIILDSIVATVITLVFIAFMLTFIPKDAYSQTFNLQLEHKYDEVYESLSGVIVVSDKECTVPDYTSVELHYFNNPADSTVGTLRDNFTYRLTEPLLSTSKACEECPIISSIVYEDVVIKCDVYGVARLKDAGVTPIEYFSRSIYDEDSRTLHLYNTEIWKQLENTQETFGYARLRLVNDLFLIEELEQ